LEHPAQYQI